MVACNTCHNEELQLLGSTVKIVGALATWRPRIVRPLTHVMTSMIGVSYQNGHVIVGSFFTGIFKTGSTKMSGNIHLLDSNLALNHPDNESRVISTVS
jgi:hypothetical protein